MRVIAGLAKGRKLFAPKGMSVRPTSDMVKESLFNIIRDRIEGATFLDLFAGSGAIGIEALSRGAGAATFIDSDPTSITVINKNLELTGLSPKAKVIRSDAIDFLSKGQFAGGPFQLIFLDPPYKIDPDMLNSIFIGLLSKHFFSGGSLIIFEHSLKRDLESLPADLGEPMTKRYGDKALSFFNVDRAYGLKEAE